MLIFSDEPKNMTMGSGLKLLNFRGMKVKSFMIAEHHIKCCIRNWILINSTKKRK